MNFRSEIKKIKTIETDRTKEQLQRNLKSSSSRRKYYVLDKALISFVC